VTQQNGDHAAPPERRSASPVVDGVSSDTARARLRAAAQHSGARYLAVGVSAFVVDLALLALLHEVLGLPVWLASGLGFALSFAYTYVMQRFAFRSTASHGGAVLRYTALACVNTVATAVIVQVVSETPLGWVGGKVVATLATTVWNYFAYRYWVYASRTTGPRPVLEG
jgi:putative flippase GtrA